MRYNYTNGVSVERNTSILAAIVAVVSAGLIATVAFVYQASAAPASTTTVVTPTSSVYSSNNVVGVANDSAPGFSYGSLASDGTGKTDMYFTPQALFGRDVTLGEVASMSYWTKKDSDHVVSPADWFINIYTKPYAEDKSTPTWYGDRIGTEPYYSANLDDPANVWNNWSTDGSANQLRFFESTQGAPGANFGNYTDKTWSDFVTSNALSGKSYATRTVLSFSAQTASVTADGFTGKIDGLTITLTDGSVAKVNFEAFEVVSSKDACKKDGWKTAKDANNNGFKNQGQCVSYVASNKNNN